MNYLEKKERIAGVVEKTKARDWRGGIQELQGGEDAREPLLIWVRPTETCLRFIEKALGELGINSVSSVGCGCGTLEWLLQEVTGLVVTGYEVNRMWWEGPHSTPHFINLKYVDEEFTKTCPLPSSSALMVCYFNNLEIFHKYLDDYKGSCVIIIGPIDGQRHCEPEPRYLMNNDDWRFSDSFNLSGEDEIAVYVRRGF